MPPFWFNKKSSLGMQRIGQILPCLLSDCGIENAVTLKFLRKNWNSIFGFPIAEHAFPKEFKNGILFVTVNSHSWLTQLNLLKDEFIAKLHAYKVKDIEFRFGRIYINQKEKIYKQHNLTLSSEQELWLRDITKNIKNNDIKQTMESLIQKYLLFVNQINENIIKNQGEHHV